MYSLEIAEFMTLTTFSKIKMNIKLCSNYAEKNRDQEGYDPTYKSDLPYKALVEKTNTITENADENQGFDESSFPHCGYGEAGSGIFLPKQEVCKGWADCSVYGFWKVPIPCVHKSPQDI